MLAHWTKMACKGWPGAIHFILAKHLGGFHAWWIPRSAFRIPSLAVELAWLALANV